MFKDPHFPSEHFLNAALKLRHELEVPNTFRLNWRCVHWLTWEFILNHAGKTSANSGAATPAVSFHSFWLWGRSFLFSFIVPPCCWRLVESAADFPSHPASYCSLAQLQTQAEMIWPTATLLIDKRDSNVLWIQLLKCDVFLLFFLVLNWSLDCWLDKTSYFLYFLTFYRQQLGLLTILLIILSINR